MDLDFIERLIRLVERSRIAEFEYATGEHRVRIVKRAAAGGPTRSSTAETPDETPDEAPGAEAMSEAAGHTVAAGIAGTFFRAEAPGSPPFAAVGDRVEEGQTLALIEAMKTFNPVEADRAGRIAAVLAEDNETVAAGAPLFRIAPT